MRHGREVHGVADDAFLQKIAQRGGGLAADLFLRLFRRRGDVRRGDDLRQQREAPVLRRLRVEDVEPGARDVALFDGVGQRRLVDQLAARCIDDADALLALREPLGIEEVPGRRQRGHVERDVVGAGAQIVERHELDAERRGHFGRDERVVGDHFHLEGVRAGRDFLSDPAESDEAEGL